MFLSGLHCNVVSVRVVLRGAKPNPTHTVPRVHGSVLVGHANAVERLVSGLLPLAGVVGITNFALLVAIAEIVAVVDTGLKGLARSKARGQGVRPPQAREVCEVVASWGVLLVQLVSARVGDLRRQLPVAARTTCRGGAGNEEKGQ